MDHKLQGKSAVITGGGGGIGRAVALNLAAEGAAIVVNDVAKEADGTRAADKVVAEIIKNGGAAVANYDSVAEFEGGSVLLALPSAILERSMFWSTVPAISGPAPWLR